MLLLCGGVKENTSAKINPSILGQYFQASWLLVVSGCWTRNHFSSFSFCISLKGLQDFCSELMFLLQKSNEDAYIWDPLAMLMKLKL